MDFMKAAIIQAKKTKKEIPVGAVIVRDNQIIASAYNRKEELSDVTAHAEILAIREAEKKLGNWRLTGCDLYVTLEPCPMCGWAIIQSRIKSIYFGSYDNTYGAFSSCSDLRKINGSNINVYGGILEKECDEILDDFFSEIRK